MISGVLAAHASAHPRREFLRGEHGSVDYETACSRVQELRAALPVRPGDRVGLLGPPQWLITHLLAVESLGARAYVLPPAAAAEAGWPERLGLQATVSEAHGPRRLAAAGDGDGAAGEVVLFTSGTTGPPKGALHTWDSLAARVRIRADLDASRWLLCFDLHTFAGLQVLLHALCNAGTLVVGPPRPRLAADAGVTHLSATPSFLRLWLATSPPEDLVLPALRHVTVGGEPVDDALLRALARQFPGVRLAHVYATTELGACFSVQDGRAGFPARWLAEPPAGVELRIDDGELWVKSPRAMRGYTDAPPPVARDGFVATGDLVERRGERVVFLGRRQERINVGGRKVHPAEVEAVLLALDGVTAARVFGAQSSVLGQIVAARVVWQGEGGEADVRRAIRRHCDERLPPYMVPRVVELVPELELAAAGKLSRR